MKISKLFHWLYTILLLLPFAIVLFNLFACFKSGVSIDMTTFESYFSFFTFSGLSTLINNVFIYLVNTLFGLTAGWSSLVIQLLTYWCTISIIWLIFDILMYVPLMAHRWIDRGVLE